jgi:hypothetical protein
MKHGIPAIVLMTTLIAGSNAADTQTELTAFLPPSCQFAGNLSASIPATPFAIQTVGNLDLVCNYVGTVNIRMLTDDGTVLKVPGEPGAEAGYRIRWLNPVPSGTAPWNSAGSAATFGPWVGLTSPTHNATQSSAVQVQILDPMTIGGTYTDTVTFTVSP